MTTNTQTPGIVLLGLGPGRADQMTRQAWAWLEGQQEVYLRTTQHPTLQDFPAGLTVHSFDALYERGERFEEVYAEIVRRVLELGQRPQGVTYAVPGNPFVAEATCPQIACQAVDLGIPVRVIDGLSFLEPTCSALGIDPFPRLSLVDALELASLHTPAFPPDQPALVAQIYNRSVASDVKLTLNAVYPDTHPVRLVHAAGTPQQVVEDLPLYEIDRSPHIGLLTTLYVPPLAPNTSMEAFQEIVAHLRAPEGCPWDREQTQATMVSGLVEEAYEALSAIEEGSAADVCEELGDVLLVVTMMAQIASEDGDFAFADVVQGIHTKIVRRHPHVFGEVQVAGSAGVLRNWEAIKAAERAAKGEEGQQKGLLDSIPKALPALMQAQSYQDRAARVGFDWSDVEGVYEKLREELQEVRDAEDDEARVRELGDVLFVLVNLIRWYKADAEAVLRATNASFKRRFAHIEAGARKRKQNLDDLTNEEMEALWQEAKKL